MVAAGGEAQGFSKGWRTYAVPVLPMVMLKLAVAVKDTRHPLRECVTRVVLLHWQHGA